MSRVIIRFSNQNLDLANLPQHEAEALAETLKADGHMNDGSTDIGVGNTRYIVNRANIDYVEVRL